ncbi:hypothetical protein ILUMI_22269 [Ignelater luminosus]|uniref:MADF domain-containing protein n=1 Tax=Ignelater luminosus TaxID=2038154 RepID=A0A8K0CAX6_IGNLU|nr:hypothetical protein ILUMI_22269 [Ignelater luminosus]
MDYCQNKWKGLLMTYKVIEDNNSQTGRGKKNWSYFKILDEIFLNNSAVEWPAINYHGNTQSLVNIPATADTSDNSPQSSRSTTPRKLKTTADLKDVLKTIIS